MKEILEQVIMSAMQSLMMRDMDQYIVIVGPGEFHFCEPEKLEFTRMHGTENMRRDSIPLKMLYQEWKIMPVDNMDIVLDLYNEVVLDIKDVDHQLVE